jgi:hypothetical protein
MIVNGGGAGFCPQVQIVIIISIYHHSPITQAIKNLISNLKLTSFFIVFIKFLGNSIKKIHYTIFTLYIYKFKQEFLR